VRIHQVGNEDRAAPPAELDRVRELCRDARGRGPADDELPARTLELDRRGSCLQPRSRTSSSSIPRRSRITWRMLTLTASRPGSARWSWLACRYW